MPAPQQRKQDPLTDKLGELENLLEQQAASDVKQQNSIPILDELVSAEDYLEDKNLSVAQAPKEGGNVLDNLVGKLETRLTIELAQAMRTLKDRLKGSIMEELQATLAGRAKPGQGHKQHGADNEAPR